MAKGFFGKIKNDKDYRITLFLCLSLIFNLGYSIFLLVVSIIYLSNWFFVMSVYYGLLSLARILIFTELRKNKPLRAKITTMRACGCFLLLINLAVSSMMFILIYGNRAVSHHEITVITLATYTFFTLTLAIVTIINPIKENNYLHSCVKVISLTSASVSLATLTNTMLVTFGDGSTQLRSIILPILCAVISAFIILCAILMICKANKDLRKLKNEKD